MKQFQKYFLFIIIITSACESEDQKPVDIGRNYLPIKVGVFQIYEVDEIQYSEEADPLELHYQLKTEVVDSFPGIESEYTYVIHRSKRNLEPDAWQYMDTWSVRINDREAVINEENISFVKIAFPVHEGKSWDGNEFNVSGEDSYEVKEVDRPYIVNDVVFEKTIFIDQENTEDLLFNNRRFEVFAKNIGLIYKETTDLEYCDDVDCFGQKEIKRGVIYKQSIVSYGSM